MVMRILVLDTDLFEEVGGGQTVYRRIIETHPHIHFTYFRRRESANARRPTNTSAVRLVSEHMIEVKDPLFPGFRRDALRVVEAFSRAVARSEFDLVEMPDYYTFGPFVRLVLRKHGVRFRGFVLAMHGNISKSIELNWGSKGGDVFHLRQLEREQFFDADACYAISERYTREWKTEVDRPVHLVDPLCFIRSGSRTSIVVEGSTPTLYCIGRMERRKGNDLFIELTRWLNPGLYEKVVHVGGQVCSEEGVPSDFILSNIARVRDVAHEIRPALDWDGLERLFATPAVVVLPVRYDSLNLIALEALFNGCPAAISSGAGACDYLDANHPGLPYVKIDLSDFLGSVPLLAERLANYAKWRSQVVDYVHNFALPTPLDMTDFYSRVIAGSDRARVRACEPQRGAQVCHEPDFFIARFSPRHCLRNWLHRAMDAPLRRKTKQLIQNPRGFLLHPILRRKFLGDAKALVSLQQSFNIRQKFGRVSTLPERNQTDLREKLSMIFGSATTLAWRCSWWREIARIERLLGNELVAVAYELRLLRLLGEDRWQLLPGLLRSLRSLGFEFETEACEALYAAKDPERAVLNYLEDALVRNLHASAKPFALVEDMRYGNPRVAVIVSLYNAAPKLRLFLRAVAQQTLVKEGTVEFIFIDSASPTHEREVLRSSLREQPLSVVYSRTENRESIQAAWNRGIHLSRAPYLVFLGVDEALYPEALQVLADELDRSPHVDWVMGNSIVTEVDEVGLYKNDVMPYDRTGGTRNHAYLETCYVSWVGGMYRRALHERVGFYDESFRAAGDTEFKNRVLPYAEIKYLPRTLGLFLNYPDQRTTASPRAEIEDTRAWYLHRTPGGIRYAFDRQQPESAKQLLLHCLGYRKSFCQHVSSDIEYGKYLADYLASTLPDDRRVARLRDDLTTMLGNLRTLEFLSHIEGRISAVYPLLRVYTQFRSMERAHHSVLEGAAVPHYRVFNDNRFEQHSWLWRSMERKAISLDLS